MLTSRRVIAVILTLASVALAGALGLWLAHVEFAMTDGRQVRATSADAAPRTILWEPPRLLPNWSNPGLDEYEPHISFDGATMLLVRARPGANADIYIAHNSADGWSDPEPLTDLNSDADDLGPELSHDGRTLIFSSNRDAPGAQGGFDLYRSHLENGHWSAPENLGAGVNTHWNEHDPALTPDAQSLYFSSNRPRDGAPPAADGRNWPATIRQDSRVHDYDIYIADLDEAEAWQAKPLDAANTTFNDGAGAVSPAGDFLYFASDRPSGRGGLDLYRIRIAPPGAWPVENIGAPINTPANELDPALTAHGFALQFSSDRALDNSSEPSQRYTLYESISREVYPDMRVAPIDWAALWAFLAPWLTWLLLALLLALLILLLARLLSDARWKGRWRALSLLARCLILSALVHLLLLALFTIWQVSSAITSLLDGRAQTQIAFISSDSGAGVESQLLAPMTDIQPPAIDVQPSRPSVSIPTIQADLKPLQSPVATRQAQLDSLDLPPQAREAPIAMSPPEVERATTTPAPPALSEPAPNPAQAVAEAQADAPHVELQKPPAPPTPPGPRPDLARLDAPVTPSAISETTAPPQIALSESSPTLPAITAPPGAAPAPPALVALPAPSQRPRPAAESAPPTLTAVHASPAPAPPSIAAPEASQAITLPPVALVAQESAAAPRLTAPSSPPPPMPSSASEAFASAALPPNLPLPESAQSGPALTEASEAPDATSIPLARTESRAAPAIAESVAPVERFAGQPVAVSAPDIVPQSRPISPAPALPAGAQPHSPRIEDVPAAPPSPVAFLALPGVESSAQAARASPESNPSELHTPAYQAPRPRVALSGRSADPPAPTSFAPASVAAGASSPERSLMDALRLGEVSPPPMAPTSLAFNIPHIPIDLPIPTDPAPTIYPQRAPEARQALVEKGGGNAETEEAVQRSLAWLARAQLPDGSWNGRSFEHACADCDGRASYEFQSAMTGLALLCFLGADNTHMKDGPYQHTVRRGLDFLLTRQSFSGDLRAGETLYSHGIASIALAEAYGMTRDPALAEPVQRAVNFIAASRSRQHGGWRYEPRQAGDTSVFGWQIMAIESARRCGITIPDDVTEEARSWLVRVSTHDAPGLYAYQPFGEPTESMTAEGLFVRQLVGLDTADADASVAFIMRHMPTWRGARGSGATYYWYYATLALYQHPGEEWGRWNRALMPILLERQRADGDAAGSWDPSDRWSEIGGRIYQTALCTLMLEVYYRYLPTYLTAAHPEPPSTP